MSVLASLLAQFLHIALVLAAAPTVLGVLHWAEARLDRRAGPHPLQAWRDLVRLIRKQPVPAENASPLFRAVPPACLAVTIVAAALVPSFTLGVAFAGLSDLLVLAGLLALPRMFQALAALDAGTAHGGLAAASSTDLACLAEPALFLVILTLGLLAGTTNLDLLAGLQHEAMLQPQAASALTAMALLTIAFGDTARTDGTAEFSATDLAMLSLAEALRLVVWFDLIAVVFLPLGMAGVEAGLRAWIIGLAAWVAKVGALTLGLALLRHATAHARRRHMSVLLGVASLLGLLAAALVVASATGA